MGLIRYIKNQFRHDRNLKSLLVKNKEEIKSFSSFIVEKMLVQQRVDFLRDKALYSNEMGVSNELYCKNEIVVSLTSFGKRIYDTYLAIESIMQGTMKPNRIVLWLSEDEFKGKPLPRTLERQKKRGLQVSYCEDLKSYNKLIPSLKLYPDACIITIDDDAMYEYDIIERIVEAHRSNPDAVCACRIHKIRLGNDHKPLSYLEWQQCIICQDRSPLYFPTGVGGVLYPPHCFHNEIFNKDVFMDSCPYADDVWFYAMLLMNDVAVDQVYTSNPKGYFMNLPSSKIDALSRENEGTSVIDCRNDVQIKAVFEKYNLYDKLHE